MASVEEVQALMEGLRQLRDEIAALDDPGVPDLVRAIREAMDEARAALGRAEAEVRRKKSGIGAAPRFQRMR